MKQLCIIALFVSIHIVIKGVKFEPNKVSDQSTIRLPFASSPDEISWGQGFNTLKLQKTYNSAVVAKSFRERSAYSSMIKMKLCQNGGEAYTFLTGDLFNAAPFLIRSSQIMMKFMKTSTITELSSILIIKFDVTTKLNEVDDIEPEGRALDLLKMNDFSSFSKFYGTHCLSRAIFGGYLYIAIKFSSNSRKEKEMLHQHLSWLPKQVKSVSELKDSLERIKHKNSIMEIDVFTVGSVQAPPAPTISEIVSFAEKFESDIEQAEVPWIHHVEYHSMLNLYTSAMDFRYFVQPILDRVDNIVTISTEFQGLVSRVDSLIELNQRDETFSFLSADAIDEIRNAKIRAMDLQNTLKARFSVSDEDDLVQLISEFKDVAKPIDDILSDTLTKERYFDTSMVFYLQSKGLNRYISIDENHYPRLTDTSPIKLEFTLIGDTSTNQVEYGHKYYLITSDTTPNYYLCMGKNNWYVFWDHQLSVDIQKCSWCLRRSSEMVEIERYARFSDILLIYNRHWPGYAIGPSNNKQWLIAVPEETAIRQSVHHWAIEKTPF